ncbi:MAG TPA: alpha-N-acetylglucosaminidase [Hanamia sp.]|nr:alpha-N-acetylglucosaminidase [Hanamia sp.]
MIHAYKKWPVLLLLFLSNICFAKQSDYAPIKGLVSRIAPSWVHQIIFQTIPSDKDIFELNWKNGKLVVEGNNINSMAVGFNYYLKYYCHTDVTWYSADKIELPEKMPRLNGTVRQKSNYTDRFFLNYCTYGYSMPWWRWHDWERFIDWMALNGVNMPLAITGQEAVWYNVWRKLGLSDKQIRNYFTGPAYLPWNRMANIDGWDGPLPQSWITGQLNLQKRIISRERSLGMKPVLPAFAGHVPEALKSRFPDAKITSLGEWGGFPEKYHSSFLDPLDPLFKKIQQLFLKEQTRLFGTDHIYGADPFNEVTPPSWEPTYLATVSRSIYHSMTEVDSSAVWLQMGWIFYYNRRNWTDIRIDSFLTAIPKGKMILLDYFAEKKEVWKQTNSFYGQPYIWCYLGNFGGNTMLAGNLSEVESRVDDTFKNGGSNLSGVGCTLEGLDMNPMMYEYVLEKAWNDKPTDINQWIRNWAIRRCGSPDINVEKAWELLYNKIYISPADNHASLINTRPTLRKKPRWFSNIHYNNSDLLEAWRLLLMSNSQKLETYRFDLVNVGRQFLENYFINLKDQFVIDYDKKDLQALISDSSRMIGLINDLDKLVGTQSSLLLGKWLKDAENMGKNKNEKLYFRKDARNIITTWGGQGQSLNDYANRSWSGLLTDFYGARWKMFLHKILTSIRKDIPFDESAFREEVTSFEWQWVQKDKTFPDKPSGDAVKISEQLYKKYKDGIQ